MKRTFRLVWGVLTLLSLAWICYGVFIASSAYGNVVSNTTSQATRAGASLGAGLGMGVYLCTGGIPLLIFGFLYWRNGVAMRHEREHEEMLEALKSKS